ncbi:MAG: bifunctional DNA primase/helicase [Acutalibacteraceae bacterium]|nr:bifunctional DNA primase/helicase [Acutalibacteraceae bacterium]
MKIDKQIILDRTDEILSFIGARKDKSGKGLICPICGSGTGKHGTGITTKDGIHWTCWTGCFTNMDIFGIIGKLYSYHSFSDQLKECCHILNIDYQEETKQQLSQKYSYRANQITETPINAPNEPIESLNEEKAETIRQTIKDAQKAFTSDCEGAKYLKSRGISYDIAKNMGIGYTTNIQGLHSCIIIPTSDNSYSARNTDAKADKNNRYRKQGKAEFFNLQAIEQIEQPVFIVEGELDALSIEQVRGKAVALGSTSNIERFVKTCKEKLKKDFKGFIISLDIDNAGIAGSDKLSKLLETQKVPHIIEMVQGNSHFDCKDVSDLLQMDAEQLKTNVNNAVKSYQETLTADERKAYFDQQSQQLNALLFNIEQQKTTISTGFNSLDNLLDGGLYSGLYFIGAISSLGKTTFCLQLVEQIAEKGQDVLIFSLEMASGEIIAKGISRNTFIISSQEYNTDHFAKTTRGILTHYKHKAYEEQEEKKVFEKAVQLYKERQPHIFITEGVGNIGVEEVKKAVEKHIRLTARKPVVLIDYIQILAPYNERATDKQNTDKAVMELKRISRDYSIPIIGISSFNRDNYRNEVSMQSFKESGAIEYSSDILLGLQYKAENDEEQEEAQKRNKEQGNKGEPQQVQLVVLKNRNGRRGNVEFTFYPKFNYFEECEDIPF